jgi:hypothetical protein
MMVALKKIHLMKGILKQHFKNSEIYQQHVNLFFFISL